MATPIEILGVVGTWVAAVVAVIALISIIGPILIWRASRTQRHRAITAVGDDNNDFVSRGYHVGAGIYLFQRVQSPKLGSPPLDGEGWLSWKPSWDVKALVRTNSPSSWVQLGCLMRAYGVQFAKEDTLEIELEQTLTLLPVHRLWILGVGVLGRYSLRKDQGKLRPVRIGRQHPRSYLHRDQTYLLHGITGTLQGEDSLSEPAICLSFSHNTHDDIKDIPSESLSLEDLFMLGKGFLPSSDGRYIDLNNSIQQDDEDSSGGNSPPEHNRHKHQEDPSYPAHRMRPTNQQQALELRVSVDLVEHSLKDVGLKFKEGAMWRLESVHMDHNTTTVLKDFVGRTYVPATSDWVRCSEDTAGIDMRSGWYIRRKDAQQLAHALLKLTWHPESYLLGVQDSSKCTELLFSASRRLYQVMGRMQPSLDKLGLGNHETGRLEEVLGQALLRRVKKLDPSNRSNELVTINRSTAHVFYKLDEVLEILCHQNDLTALDDQINCMIGVLMLTNNEFANLLSQSVRCLDDSTNSAVEVDMCNATLKVPAAFGVRQSFIVDLNVLYPNGVASAEVITIPYSTILLVSLKACLRSAMLRTCFDGYPLFDVFNKSEEVTKVK